MMKKIKPTLVLTVICLVISLLLSVVNMFTATVIADRQKEEANKALLEVLPEGKNFEQIELTGLPTVITTAYKADGGFVFEMTVTGYKPGLVIMCGVDSTGKIAGVKHLQTSETYGFEPELNSAYVGDSLDSLELILATGASKNSKTSKAYYDAINAALQAAAILGGEEVDLRTPEQILQDNCNAALGVTGKTFTRWWSSWDALGNAEVYVSDDGVVISVNSSFVGYKNGADTPVGTHTDELIAAVTPVFNTYSSTTKINKADYTGISQTVKDIHVNADGQYMFLLSSKGYEWAPAPIVIELIIDAEGKIVSCVTISQEESGKYGSTCGEPEYYEQYVGKDAETYDSVPGITATAKPDTAPGTGATQTSKGYKKAIKAAFDAFAIITDEGGND